jgi:hypothetical protein
MASEERLRSVIGGSPEGEPDAGGSTGTRKEHRMHPFQYQGLANARQAELIREAAEARLAGELPGRDARRGPAGRRHRRLVVAVTTIVVGAVALVSGAIPTQDLLAAIRML